MWHILYYSNSAKYSAHMRPRGYCMQYIVFTQPYGCMVCDISVVCKDGWMDLGCALRHKNSLRQRAASIVNFDQIQGLDCSGVLNKGNSRMKVNVPIAITGTLDLVGENQRVFLHYLGS